MKKKVWRKYTKSDISKRKKKLFELVKKICRDRGPCIMAGLPTVGACGGYMQASHIKSEGAWKNMFIDPRNIYPMCYRHHFTFWHKDVTEWAKWFELTYPLDYLYLEDAKKRSYDFNNPVTLETLFAAAEQGYEAYQIAYDSLSPAC